MRHSSGGNCRTMLLLLLLLMMMMMQMRHSSGGNRRMIKMHKSAAKLERILSKPREECTSEELRFLAAVLQQRSSMRTERRRQLLALRLSPRRQLRI